MATASPRPFVVGSGRWSHLLRYAVLFLLESLAVPHYSILLCLEALLLLRELLAGGTG